MSIELFSSAEKYPLLEREPQLFPLRELYGGHPVWMWRDDPEDFGFGGNKVRFYEYLIPQILAQSPDVIVTVGSRFSNHLRVTALVAARLGIHALLLVNEEEPEGGKLPEGNLTLAAAAGAEISFIGSFAAELRVAMIVKGLKREGKKVFSVPAGGHNPGAVRSYANVFCEALMMLDGLNVQVSRVFLPCASGTTQTGLLCGAAMLSRYMEIPKITSFAVANTPADAEESEKDFFADACASVPELSGLAAPASEVRDCGKNAYGAPDAELTALRDTVSAAEGVTLDRVYNINAFFGMKTLLEAEPGDAPVLYVNTGGYTG